MSTSFVLFLVAIHEDGMPLGQPILLLVRSAPCSSIILRAIRSASSRTSNSFTPKVKPVLGVVIDPEDLEPGAVLVGMGEDDGGHGRRPGRT